MYRMVDCETWHDAWFAELPPDAKLVFLYLVTNPRSTTCGAFELTIRKASFDLGIDAARCSEILSSFGDRVRWWSEHQVVWVRNFYRRQQGDNPSPKYRANARKAVMALPAVVRDAVCMQYPDLRTDGDTPSIPYQDGMDTVSIDPPARRETAPAPAPEKEPRPQPHQNGADESSSWSPTYAETLNGAYPQVVRSFAELSKEMSEGWFRTALAEIERDVGPLPRDALQEGLGVAFQQVRRAMDSERKGGRPIATLRGLSKKIILDSLKEQASGTAA